MVRGSGPSLISSTAALGLGPLEKPATLVGHIALGQLELVERIGLALDIE